MIVSIVQYPATAIRISLPQAFSLSTCGRKFSNASRMMFMVQFGTRVYCRKLPKNLCHPQQSKLPPDPGVNIFLKNRGTSIDPTATDLVGTESLDLVDGCLDGYEEEEEEEEEDDGKKEDNVWESDEIDAISSLFQGRVPQKPGKLSRVRPLPLSLPHKLRPVGLPTSKRRVRVASSSAFCLGASLSKKLYKNPDFLIGLAREIRSLPEEQDVSKFLNKWVHVLQKGSLSLTIRELGHMGLPERALQTFCWVQKQPQLFPDDRVLASTVEVLAGTRHLKLPFNLARVASLASGSVIEAMVRGFIRGRNLNLAWKLLMIAKDGNKMLDSSIYAKLILELGKNPDKQMLVLSLLDELGEREDLQLSQQDCTSVMKVCARLGRYNVVESLFNWYKQSGHNPSVVMYTNVIQSRYLERKYREALALVWEMEALNYLFDLPAYRVVIKLFVALNDLPRTVRYFSKLKEAGFSPTYDIYRDVIKIYMVSGRLAKCKEVCKEVEAAGFKLEKQLRVGIIET
ncbi:pentatricopeptide repeat-containing protein At2g01860 isoform X2 [Malania oleifera]|nr:pentatricopeptide repeat-containing protein At2g01860 isoform X2 [Malania oleifera]XP_057974441.1 pentatricopeptide repeat-containing protein At2g01860 isoform X2 [Malania oleifera]XP_057974442.1 pentatricopeptide repeat-containing protein At2g01860 isoform X2 [Malania oleifera]XP_057974443.1 pentatricopeptide repeat-containing protein At2g01860 isoform X2 [Malania oleifera]XP_057974445.1 pentatricopeptide repeat-containing protein At2g01860 isoform X2 [Malania oleifera]XP_057974446.1 penta